MARKPADRFTADELVRALKQYLTGDLVFSHRYSLSGRLARWARRHKTATVTVLFLTLAIVAGALGWAEWSRQQKEEAERRKAADDSRLQQLREADLQKQLQEEEGEAVARGSPAMAQYVAMIKQQVERRWTRPLSAMTGLECEVRVAQTPTGTVLSVEVGRCNGDAAVRQSIETAVHRASPLPPPPDPRMFQRNLVFIFKPEA